VELPAATSRVETRRSRPPAWLLYSLLTILLWGIWSTLTKVIADDISAYMNQVLFAIGILPVIAVVLRSPRLVGGQNRKRGIFYAFITGILGGTGNILFFEALRVGGKASVVVPTTSLSPLVTVVLGYVALRERTNTLQKLGVALALVAIYLLSLE
jgi:bacterial/archaeal transporter family protein